MQKCWGGCLTLTKSRLHSLALEPNCHLHCVSALYSCPGSCSGYLYWPICLGSSTRQDAWAVLVNTANKSYFRKRTTATENVESVLTGGTEAYPRNRLRYCRLQVDQKKTPLFPARVGDIMLPSVLRHGFPSPSWIIPKLEERIDSQRVWVISQCGGRSEVINGLIDANYPIKQINCCLKIPCSWRPFSSL